MLYSATAVWISSARTFSLEKVESASPETVGIPVDDNKDLTKPNEFQIWMRAIYNSSNPNLEAAIKKGEGIAIKADKDTPYNTVTFSLEKVESASPETERNTFPSGEMSTNKIDNLTYAIDEIGFSIVQTFAATH